MDQKLNHLNDGCKLPLRGSQAEFRAHGESNAAEVSVAATGVRDQVPRRTGTGQTSVGG